MQNSQRIRILILGGGFAGLTVAMDAIGLRTGQLLRFRRWWLWRTIYLSKLPRFEKKLRVAFDWTLDLIFSKDLVQFLDIRAPRCKAGRGPRKTGTITGHSSS